MTEEMLPVFGEEEANTLLKSEWRQCQIFRPNDTLPHPEKDIFFVVCTQSCTVVSPDLTRDPFVEIAIGRPLRTFQAKNHQARGKDVRKFHIPIIGADFEALEIDINSRQFVKRELLLVTETAGFTVSDKTRRDFAGWIARYYTRIALPNELVARLKPILKNLKQFLETKDGDQFVPHHEQIASMWIRFNPDAELHIGETYTVKLLIVSDEPGAAEDYDRELHKLFGRASLAIDGVAFSFDVNSLDETRLTDLDGYQRFTDWDYLSGMGDVAAIPSPP
jgi:hypothetical protein